MRKQVLQTEEAVTMPQASPDTVAAPLLAIDMVSKTFAGQRALAGVSLAVRSGEIHALVGQNGSGKSTLVKILAGYHLADPGGSIKVAGTELDASGSRRLRGQIGFVHQDLALIPTLGAVDNIAIGRGYVQDRLGSISWRREASSCRRLLAEMGHDIDVDRPVGLLSPVERTCVAIARALAELSGDARVLVLDEPTASLPKAEVVRLFAVVRTLAANGAGILYISHHLDEVLDLASRVTVLRDGQVAHAGDVAGLTHDDLVRYILGRSPAELAARQQSELGPPVLEAAHVRGGARATRFSLTVRAGEIVGVAGIDGSGREDVCPLLAGAETPDGGAISVAGRAVRLGAPHDALGRGLAYVPANRHRDGLVMSHTVRENITLPALGSLVNWAGLRLSAERADAGRWARRVQLNPPGTEAPVDRLSGGNQQKVVLAKALRTGPKVLALDEPTQAVDVGAAAEIMQLVVDSAARGCAVVLASLDAELLATYCQRVLVLRRGRVATELRGADVTSERIAEECLRAEAAAPGAAR
jgi:ribose transport system ATP-binding protein